MHNNNIMKIILIKNGLRNLFHNLGLWPRLSLTISLGFLLFFTIFSSLSMRIVNDSTNRILEERMVLTRMASSEIDELLTQAFHELEKATTFARFDPQASNLGEEYHILAHSYGRISTLSLGVIFLDSKGKVVLTEPYQAELINSDQSARPHIRKVILSGQRSVSIPFLEPRTGSQAVALTIPIRNEQGQFISMLIGLIDLSSKQFRRPMEHALKLGHTGHAEIVDSEGMVVASTDPGMFLKPGEHVTFYKTMMTHKIEGVDTVPYENEQGETESMHVMAFAPLSMADWGLALGGYAEETFAPVVALRNSIFFFGGLMLLAILSATLIGAHLLVRPIKALTEAAQGIAQGNLTNPIQLSEGGEIGVLGKSLEEMRLGLKKSIEEIQGWNTELEKRVKERSQELEKLMEEVSRLHAMRELDRLKSEFISSISHELRTPLGFIKGYATTLLRSDVKHTEEIRQEFLQIINEESEKLQELIENLLDTSRIQSGSFVIDKRPMDIVELARQVVEKAKTTTDKHAFSLLFDTPPASVHGDPRRLEQVLQNLLDNAIKYSPHGGLITIREEMRDEHIQISVSDQGRGISQGELTKIFDAFYRIPGTEAQKIRGAGLGLTICKAIVEAHGGRIWAESAPGKGSAFHFTLPLQ